MSTVALSLDSTVVACKDQVSADLANETVVLNLKNGGYYGLNEVGARIWMLIQEPRSLESVRLQLVEEYADADPDVCGRDVIALANQLSDAALIQVVPSSTP